MLHFRLKFPLVLRAGARRKSSADKTANQEFKRSRSSVTNFRNGHDEK
jgi:hypothetical protein